MRASLDPDSACVLEVQRKRRERENLDTRKQECEKQLESLHQQEAELRKEFKRLRKLNFDNAMKASKDDVAYNEQVARERKESFAMDEAIKRLEEELAELTERKQKQKTEVDRLAQCREFLEEVVKLTEFENVDQLANQLENLFLLRDQQSQKLNEKQEQASQLRKKLLKLEDQHYLFQLQKDNELSKQQTTLEDTQAEAQTWERAWDHIQETAAKKTLLLGQIKMGILNLYEMTGDQEGVDINDTEKQLEKVKMFIQDHEDILKQYMAASERGNDGQKMKKKNKLKTRKPNVTPHKKN